MTTTSHIVGCSYDNSDKTHHVWMHLHFEVDWGVHVIGGDEPGLAKDGPMPMDLRVNSVTFLQSDPAGADPFKEVRDFTKRMRTEPEFFARVSALVVAELIGRSIEDQV